MKTGRELINSWAPRPRSHDLRHLLALDILANVTGAGAQDDTMRQCMSWDSSVRGKLFAIQCNSKTGYSVDTSSECTYRAMGKVCPYCFNEPNRTRSHGRARNLPQTKALIKAYAPAAHLVMAMPAYMVAFLNRQYGGLRFFSFGDFTGAGAQMLTDIVNACASRGLRIKIITKSTDTLLWAESLPAFYASDANGIPMMRINISTDTELAPAGSAIRQWRDLGLFNTVDIDHAYQWVQKYPDRVAVRYMASNWIDLLAALDDPRVGNVTPYHGDTGATLQKLFYLQQQILQSTQPAGSYYLQQYAAFYDLPDVMVERRRQYAADHPELAIDIASLAAAIYGRQLTRRGALQMTPSINEALAEFVDMGPRSNFHAYLSGAKVAPVPLTPAQKIAAARKVCCLGAGCSDCAVNCTWGRQSVNGAVIYED